MTLSFLFILREFIYLKQEASNSYTLINLDQFQ